MVVYFTPNSSTNKLNIVSHVETCTGVTVELEVFDKRYIVKSSYLWDTIHAFPNINKDCVVNKELLNLVFINEILGGGPLWWPHVCVLMYSGVEVKFLDV